MAHLSEKKIDRYRFTYRYNYQQLQSSNIMYCAPVCRLNCHQQCADTILQCNSQRRYTCGQILAGNKIVRGRLKCDGTQAETRLRLSAKRTSPFKSAGASVQPSTGSRRVRISGSNAGYTMFRGSVKGTGHSLHSPVSPSLPLPCVTVRHHISTCVYNNGSYLLF